MKRKKRNKNKNSKMKKYKGAIKNAYGTRFWCVKESNTSVWPISFGFFKSVRCVEVSTTEVSCILKVKLLFMTKAVVTMASLLRILSYFVWLFETIMQINMYSRMLESNPFKNSWLIITLVWKCRVYDIEGIQISV